MGGSRFLYALIGLFYAQVSEGARKAGRVKFGQAIRERDQLYLSYTLTWPETLAN